VKENRKFASSKRAGGLPAPWDRSSGPYLCLWALLLLLSGCASMARLDSVPPALQSTAQPLGIPGLRIYPERNSDSSAPRRLPVAWSTPSIERSGDATHTAGYGDMLAISAGGDGGAFAAGILTGWSQTGTRPTFAVVTGVSAGALIAPFAYLGPKYDHVLRDVTLGPDEFFHKRGLIAGLLGDAFAGSEPLQQLLATYVTPEVMRDIAREYRRGRDLYIMTTNLDAGTPVIWNMGAIAASDAPGSLALFRQVMLASASVPAAVSPVLIKVTADGHTYQELHVDGGVVHQVFLYPFQGTPWDSRTVQQPAHPPRAFLIMNTDIEMKWSPTPLRALKIGSRALDTMVQVEARNDIDDIFAALRRQGVAMNLAYVHSDFHCPHPHAFDHHYMSALFSYGERMALTEHPWRDAPPDMEESPARSAAKPTLATANRPPSPAAR
jgi:hypothetical protein